MKDFRRTFLLDFTLSAETDVINELVQSAFNYGFSQFIVDQTLLSRLQKFPDYTLYVYNQRNDPYGVIFRDEELGTLTASTVPQDQPWGAFLSIKDKQDELQAVELAKWGAEFIICETPNWNIIPMENLIAELQKSTCELYAYVSHRIDNIDILFNTLEKGVDGLVVQPQSSEDLLGLTQYTQQTPFFDLISAQITEIIDIPEAERVCVDTSSLLHAGEGMLVGNTAQGFGLVHAEVFDSEFVGARPFRVNAGDVSEYIIVPDTRPKHKAQFRTQYLAELKAGDPILIVNQNGESRTVSISRVKIETRPMRMLKMQAQTDKGRISLIITVQLAETVRLMQSDAKITSVTDLSVGDTILVFLGPGATHFGTQINEKIVEK